MEDPMMELETMMNAMGKRSGGAPDPRLEQLKMMMAQGGSSGNMNPMMMQQPAQEPQQYRGPEIPQESFDRERKER